MTINFLCQSRRSIQVTIQKFKFWKEEAKTRTGTKQPEMSPIHNSSIGVSPSDRIHKVIIRPTEDRIFWIFLRWKLHLGDPGIRICKWKIELNFQIERYSRISQYYLNLLIFNLKNMIFLWDNISGWPSSFTRANETFSPKASSSVKISDDESRFNLIQNTIRHLWDL